MTLYQQYDRADSDWYVEPEEAVFRLLDVERFFGLVVDPACGQGTIPEACRKRGLDAGGYELRDRGYGVTGQDFLGADWSGRRVNSIISNPPYRLAEKFLHRALQVSDHKVAFFLRLNFLEGQTRSKSVFNGATPLARVWVFPDRVNAPPGHLLQSGAIERGGTKYAFAWFLWEHGYRGLPTIGWLPPAKTDGE